MAQPPKTPRLELDSNEGKLRILDLDLEPGRYKVEIRPDPKDPKKEIVVLAMMEVLERRVCSETFETGSFTLKEVQIKEDKKGNGQFCQQFISKVKGQEFPFVNANPENPKQTVGIDISFDKKSVKIVVKHLKPEMSAKFELRKDNVDDSMEVAEFVLLKEKVTIDLSNPFDANGVELDEKPLYMVSNSEHIVSFKVKTERVEPGDIFQTKQLDINKKTV